MRLRKRLRGLANNPLLGKARDEVKESDHSFNEGSHVIFYRVAGDDIEIIGIPRQSMDVEQHLSIENLLAKNTRDEPGENYLKG